MEVCLPAEFYQLRDELPVDWAAPDHPWSPRHLDSCPARDHVNQWAQGLVRGTDFARADSINSCADPAWRVF